jgi:hypothetical protein
MALSSSEIYQLKAFQPREECVKFGVDATGTVQFLRQRLAKQLKVAAMAENPNSEDVKAIGAADVSLDPIRVDNPVLTNHSHVPGMSDANLVLIELMRKVPPLTSEEPKAILRFVARLEDVYLLKLCDDRSFITRILPLVPGVLLRFFGECLRNGKDWKQSKQQLLSEFFPHFIRERLVRDLITFNFHNHATPVREYIDQVFSAARFLEYEAEEQSLVDRIVMNLHPDILAQSAFVDRPRSRKELYDVVGMVEEKMAVVRERQRNLATQQITSREEPRDSTGRQNVVDHSRPLKCLFCGRLGHVQRNCDRRAQQSGNGREPGGSGNPGRVQ